MGFCARICRRICGDLARGQSFLWCDFSWEHHPVESEKLIHPRQFFYRRSSLNWWQRVTAEAEEDEDFAHDFTFFFVSLWVIDFPCL
jgi:hypothetical protein